VLATVGFLFATLPPFVQDTELPAPLLAAYDAAWKITKTDAFAYWRSYSSDMPDRETLDQGGAYVAGGKK